MLSFCNSTRLIYIICSLVSSRYIWFKIFFSLKKHSLEDSIYVLLLEYALKWGTAMGGSETKLWTWFDMICFVALELGRAVVSSLQKTTCSQACAQVVELGLKASSCNITQIIQHFSPSSKLISHPLHSQRPHRKRPLFEITLLMQCIAWHQWLLVRARSAWRGDLAS